MTANNPIEATLLSEAVIAIRDRLPTTWVVELEQVGTGGGTSVDTIVLRTPGSTFIPFAVEAKPALGPRDVPALLSRLARALRPFVSNVPLLVVAPWISPRTQALLTEEAINFVDLTGNVRVQCENPALFISSTGASRDPNPPPRSGARVRGPKAGRLIRTLVDTRPPYGVRELATATGLTPGYVSRLLDSLDREGLIERSRRGAVESVDIRAMLRRWSESYDVLRANRAAGFISRAGVAAAHGALTEVVGRGRIAVTGSFAAVRFSPVTAPTLLLAYCDDVSAVARALELLPTDRGADVVLLQPFDAVVWDGCSRDVADGVDLVAPSQVAVDCLTGVGRMPAEGDAMLDWMADNEDIWRRSQLVPLKTPARPSQVDET